MHWPFRSLAGFPAVEIPAKDEKLAADLNDRNVIFFNDSAEMPNRESSEFGGCRNVQKHFGAGLSGGAPFRGHLPSSFLIEPDAALDLDIYPSPVQSFAKRDKSRPPTDMCLGRPSSVE